MIVSSLLANLANNRSLKTGDQHLTKLTYHYQNPAMLTWRFDGATCEIVGSGTRAECKTEFESGAFDE